MTATRSIAARAKLIAAVTTLLILIGAGGAAAYWTASAQLEGKATAASIGVTQTDPLKLKTVYDAGNLRAADTVTIHNSGSAPAELTVVVNAQGGSALPAVLRVAIATKTGSTACGPNAELSQPLTGGLGLTYTGELEAGESIDLCVRTSLPARAAFSHAGEQTGITVTSTLTYADGAEWTRSTSGKVGAPVAQSVNRDPAVGVETAACEDWSAGLGHQRFTTTAGATEGNVVYRAYLVQGRRTADLPKQSVRFEESNGKLHATVPERVLWDTANAQGNWDRGNTSFVLEKKPAGASDEAWTTAGLGKFRYNPLVVFKDIYCGWN